MCNPFLAAVDKSTLSEGIIADIRIFTSLTKKKVSE